MEEWEAFCEFLSKQQPPRSLSESTADDAIEFLISLPTDRIDNVFSRLSAASYEEIDGGQKDLKGNPFGSPIVGTYLKKRVKEKVTEKEYGEKMLTYQSLPGGYKSNITARHGYDKEDLFGKCLTTSDVSSLNRLVVTANEDLGRYFLFATIVNNVLQVEDEEGKPWLFGFSYHNVSQSYEFTIGWSSYVKAKQLGAGDFFFFQRDRRNSSRIFIGYRKRDADAALRNDTHESSQSAVSAVLGIGRFLCSVEPKSFTKSRNYLCLNLITFAVSMPLKNIGIEGVVNLGAGELR